jgi:hypothetical protein
MGIGSKKKSIGSTAVFDLPGLSQGRQYGEIGTELNQTFKELTHNRSAILILQVHRIQRAGIIQQRIAIDTATLNNVLFLGILVLRYVFSIFLLDATGKQQHDTQAAHKPQRCLYQSGSIHCA